MTMAIRECFSPLSDFPKNGWLLDERMRMNIVLASYTDSAISEQSRVALDIFPFFGYVSWM